MTPLIEKYISTQRIKDIARDKNFDETTLQQFMKYLDEIISAEEARYGQEYIEEYLDMTIQDGCLFIEERKKGFSEKWATIYVKMLNEHNHNPAALAFWDLEPLNKQEAQQNFRLYCKLTFEDELYRNYFADLVMNNAESAKEIEGKAALYSKTYKEQISNGRSELFADKYSDQKSRGINDVGCFTYASEYEKAILAGFSNDYASGFADGISEYIAKHFVTYDQSIDDVLVNLEKERLKKKYHHLK